MITMNDYLYSGNTVLKILQRYHNDHADYIEEDLSCHMSIFQGSKTIL